MNNNFPSSEICVEGFVDKDLSNLSSLGCTEERNASVRVVKATGAASKEKGLVSQACKQTGGRQAKADNQSGSLSGRSCATIDEPLLGDSQYIVDQPVKNQP